MASKIVRHDGWDLSRVQRYLFEQGDGVARTPAAIHPIVTGGAGYKMTYLPIWGGGLVLLTAAVMLLAVFRKSLFGKKTA